MTMPTPTQAEYAAADTIVHLLGSDPAYARERIAQLIATERAMVDLTISQNQMTTDSARPHVVADPAQAHARKAQKVNTPSAQPIERWNTGESMEVGFWNIVSESGRVIALRVTEEKYARKICDDHNHKTAS